MTNNFTIFASNIQILKLGKIEPFLDRALQSPSSESLKNAIQSLTELVSIFSEMRHIFTAAKAQKSFDNRA